MQGDPKVDELMRPVLAAIKRHVKNSDAITDIYNRAYEAVMEIQDALNVSAAVTAKQIAENAKNLQRAEAAEARQVKLHEAIIDGSAKAAIVIHDSLVRSGAIEQHSGISVELAQIIAKEIIATYALKDGEK